MVVASAVDEQGGEIYPRKWNNEFIDLPVVEKDKQNTPSFSAEVMRTNLRSVVGTMRIALPNLQPLLAL